MLAEIKNLRYETQVLLNNYLLNLLFTYFKTWSIIEYYFCRLIQNN